MVFDKKTNFQYKTKMTRSIPSFHCLFEQNPINFWTRIFLCFGQKFFLGPFIYHRNESAATSFGLKLISKNWFFRKCHFCNFCTFVHRSLFFLIQSTGLSHINISLKPHSNRFLQIETSVKLDFWLLTSEIIIFSYLLSKCTNSLLLGYFDK